MDKEISCKPEICIDVKNWNYEKYPPGYFRVIAAGVPCTEYSQAKTTGKRDLEKADQIVQQTLKIINYLSLKFGGSKTPEGGN